MTQLNTDRIEKQIELKAPVGRVWRALTNYQEFGQWFGVNLQAPFLAGRSTRGNITHRGYEHLVMEVDVCEMDDEKLFSFHWHPAAIDPDVDYSEETPTLVEFKLEPTDDGTLLTLTESGFDALPAERRDEAFRMNEGGWTQQVQNIETYVKDNP